MSCLLSGGQLYVDRVVNERIKQLASLQIRIQLGLIANLIDEQISGTVAESQACML